MSKKYRRLRLSKKIEDAVRDVACEIVEQMGFELVDVEYVKGKGADSELIIYIDKEGGATLNDCEDVSRALDEPIDKLDPISEPYMFCVSSPGIDRVLKTDRDFTKEQGKKVEVKLYAKKDGKKEFLGELLGHDEDTVTIGLIEQQKGRPERRGADLVLKKEEIAQIRLHVDFNELVRSDDER